jgi:hypothetical protein
MSLTDDDKKWINDTINGTVNGAIASSETRLMAAERDLPLNRVPQMGRAPRNAGTLPQHRNPRVGPRNVSPRGRGQ